MLAVAVASDRAAVWITLLPTAIVPAEALTDAKAGTSLYEVADSSALATISVWPTAFLLPTEIAILDPLNVPLANTVLKLSAVASASANTWADPNMSTAPLNDKFAEALTAADASINLTLNDVDVADAALVTSAMPTRSRVPVAVTSADPVG